MVSTVAFKREGYGLDPGPGASVWRLHVLPVSLGSLEVLRVSPMVQKHAREVNWVLQIGRYSECYCDWLFCLSRWPCNKLVTCPGYTLPVVGTGDRLLNDF